MLNIWWSGWGSKSAVVSVPALFVDPVVPSYGSEFAALTVAFAQDDGGYADGGGDSL